MTRRRILVVDDEEGLRTSLAANLELEGYEVAEASSGPQAIDLVRGQPFDLVLSDIRMPGMSGVDAFRAIRKLRPDLGVVMMTAFAVEHVVDEAVLEGAYAVVRKPFSMTHLFDLLARAIERGVVLVVDDIADASAIAEDLRAIGLRAATAHDEEAAARIIREGTIDVCVLDLLTPGMEDVAAFERVRRLDPAISVIGVIGVAALAPIHDLVNAGVYACLRKPVDARELVRAIARARGDPSRR
jgi:two-component system, NtrC family, response regulator HydG